jgi:hypothetical protein
VKLSVEEFHQELVDALLKYLPSGDLEIIEMSILRLKVRFYIAVSFFVDIFYAVRTQKVSFAVKKGRESLVLIISLIGILIPLAKLKNMLKYQNNL